MVYLYTRIQHGVPVKRVIALAQVEPSKQSAEFRERQVRLLFKKVHSVSLHRTMEMANCTSPSIPASELARWEAWLEENGIAKRSPRGISAARAYTLGILDPHLLEIASPASGRSIEVVRTFQDKARTYHTVLSG